MATLKRPLLRTILWNKKQGFAFLERYKQFVRLRVTELDRGGPEFVAYIDVLPLEMAAPDYLLDLDGYTVKWWKDKAETDAVAQLLMSPFVQLDTAKTLKVRGDKILSEIDWSQ